tara:strand:+ start:204 stop:455 length:252 start_codon:yes stop_codon:yes gene_type:complete
MTDKTYNGWSNYATWRIKLEIFDGYETDGQRVDKEYLKDIAEEIVLGDVNEQSLAHSYAHAFMSDVNWHEIAEHINDEIKENE